MDIKKYHEVPLVMKTPVSLVVVSSDREANALRAVLEGFNFRVDVLWVGSRAELVEVIKGKIGTQKHIIFSCHGVKEGIYIADEKPLSPEEISRVVNMNGKIVLNLGCNTGGEEYEKAFIEHGNANVYIAPNDYPEGSAALMFAIHFFYGLANKKTLEDAFQSAQSFNNESGMFELFNK